MASPVAYEVIKEEEVVGETHFPKDRSEVKSK